MEDDPYAHEPDDQSGQSSESMALDASAGDVPLDPLLSQWQLGWSDWSGGTLPAVWQDMLNDPVHRDQAVAVASDISAAASVEELAARWGTTPEGVKAWVEQVGSGMGWSGAVSEQYAALRSTAGHMLDWYSTLSSDQIDQPESEPGANQVQGQLDDTMRDPQDPSGGLSWQQILDHFNVTDQDLDAQAQLSEETVRTVSPPGQLEPEGMDQSGGRQAGQQDRSQDTPYLEANGKQFPLAERQWQILTVLPRTRANFAETRRITVIDETTVAKEVTEIGSWLDITGAAKAIAAELADLLKKREATIPPHPKYSEVPSIGKVAFLRPGEDALLRAVVDAQGSVRIAARNHGASKGAITALLKTIGPDLGFADDTPGQIALRLAGLWKSNALTISRDFIHCH